MQTPNNKRQQRGMALLLTVLILAALTSISSGIFAAVFGEIRISGEVGDSFNAYFAADQGMERLLYCDRVSGAACPSWTCAGASDCTYGPVVFGPSDPLLPSGACMTLVFNRRSGRSTARSIGEFRCASTTSVKRTASVSY